LDGIICEVSASRYFNPTMVRLLPFREFWRQWGHQDFNPTMVRLLLTDWIEFVTFTKLFQSHNGAIAAKERALKAACKQAFQSHNGAIAAKERALKAACKQAFQSHNGAIAAEEWRILQQKWEEHFNPTMVRLLPPFCFATHHIGVISIPQWCDCCPIP